MVLTTVELFAGMGGLALGATQAGFQHKAVVENNKNACQTILNNVNSGRFYTRNWPLHEADVCKFDYSGITDTDVLAGGVPCQPFSHAGSGDGDIDKRNLFPEFFRAQHELEPRVAVIENVPAIATDAFPQYLNYLKLQMSMPGIRRGSGEKWREHLSRLASAQASGWHRGSTYRVAHAVLNAADFGVPQWRERLFIVGFRRDLKTIWSPPHPTHSREGLVWEQWITGSYWAEHGLQRPRNAVMSRRLMPLVRRRNKMVGPYLPRWRTVRDALKALPTLRIGERDPADPLHYLNPGARSYGGHNGSRLDEPSKTIKAGVHGVPGGENTLYLGKGRVRYYSVREAAVIQGFPRDYDIHGVWIAGMRQVGNAVPPPLAYTVFQGIRESLDQNTLGP